MSSKNLKSITQLKLKIDVDDTRLAHLLKVGMLCRRARNGALENWLLRQRGLPESSKQGKRSPKNPDKGLSESAKIYHAVTAAAPELDTAMASMLANGLDSQLRTKIDWRRQPGVQKDGNEKPKKLRRSDSILSYEDRPPFYTALDIPVRSAVTKFTFIERPQFTVTLLRGQRITFTLSTSRLSGGYKTLLHELASGKRKLADSRIVHRDGEWFWHVPFQFETTVSSDIEATLRPEIGGNASQPMRLELPNRKPWGIGDGRYLLAQTARLIALRKDIGWRYRQRMGAGHGRKKIDEAVRKRSQQLANIVSEVRRRMIRNIVDGCIRAGVGKLIYREPSLPVREKCWFAANGLDWDWTRFVGDLENAAARYGIEVMVAQLKLKEMQADEVRTQVAV